MRSGPQHPGTVKHVLTSDWFFYAELETTHLIHCPYCWTEIKTGARVGFHHDAVYHAQCLNVLGFHLDQEFRPD